MMKTALMTGALALVGRVLVAAQGQGGADVPAAGYSGVIVLIAAAGGILVGYGLAAAQARRRSGDWTGPAICGAICTTCGQKCTKNLQPPHRFAHTCPGGHVY